MTGNQIWMSIGLAGQVLFMSRFLVQWISSESEQRSVIPVSFWYLSLAGSTLLLSYAVWRQDIVFMIGQGAGFFIYIRNLQLIAKRAATCRRDRDEIDGSSNSLSIAACPPAELRQVRGA